MCGGERLRGGFTFGKRVYRGDSLSRRAMGCQGRLALALGCNSVPPSSHTPCRACLSSIDVRVRISGPAVKNRVLGITPFPLSDSRTLHAGPELQ